MPYVPGTPESRIQRSDSKNPATTCKGITAEGKHCRRDIAAPKSPKHDNHNLGNGVVAVLPAGDDEHDGAAAYFCWQHKDQAASLTSVNNDGRKAKIVPVKKRTSVDTLADRLGLVDLDEDDEPNKQRHRRKHHTNPRPARKDTLPQQWQNMDGPLLAVQNKKSSRPNNHAKQKRRGSNVGLFCCIRAESVEPVRPSRPVNMTERPDRVSAAHNYTPTQHRYTAYRHPSPSTPSRPDKRYISPRPDHSSSDIAPPKAPFARPYERRRSSQTQTLLSWIPPTLSPATTSGLLAELAKPISCLDEEGYIYMFWLTEQFTARSIATPSPACLISDSDDSFRGLAAPSGGKKSQNTVLLKIGRAANVQRRMQQWNRQCGYELDVIRYYPYSPASARDAIPPMKVPYSHKAERLIHIELADRKVKRDCDACGKQHREWFEVEGTKHGMKSVDEVCKRWCKWAEMQVYKDGK